MKTKKVFFHVFFGLELVGLGGCIGKVAYNGLQNFKNSAIPTGDVTKDTMITLAVLLIVGFVGFLVSNKLVDQLDKACAA